MISVQVVISRLPNCFIVGRHVNVEKKMCRVQLKKNIVEVITRRKVNSLN